MQRLHVRCLHIISLHLTVISMQMKLVHHLSEVLLLVPLCWHLLGLLWVIPVVELQVSVLCCSVYSVNKCFSFLNACSVDGVHSNTAFLDSRACSGAVFAEI